MRHFPLIIALCLPVAGCADAGDCELHEALAQATSPDGAWLAVFYNNVCGGWIVTATSATVELTRPGEATSGDPVDARTVFGMGDLTDAKKVAVTWTGPRTLEITIPNDALIGTQKSAFADVTITYKYVPDDPVERACLAYRRSLSLEESQKLGLYDAYLAKCRAQGGPPKGSPR